MPTNVRRFVSRIQNGNVGSNQIGLESYWPWGVSVDDLNADGYQDVFITAGMAYYFRYGINSLLLNDAGKTFLSSEFLLGVEPPARQPGRDPVV
jgi:hypothetical protein